MKLRIDQASERRLREALARGRTLLVFERLDAGLLKRLRQVIGDLVGPEDLKRVSGWSAKAAPARRARRGDRRNLALPATLTHDWLGQHLLESFTNPLLQKGERLGIGHGVRAVDDVEAALHEVRDRLEREQRLHVSAGDLTPKALAAAIAVEVAPDSEEDRILVREMVLEMAAKQNKRIVRGFGDHVGPHFQHDVCWSGSTTGRARGAARRLARPLDLLSLTPLARRLPRPELRPGQRWDDPSAGRSGRESEHLSAWAHVSWRRRLLHSP